MLRKNVNRFEKIIYIILHPYWQRDHHRFGAEYMMEKGYSVEIWRMMNRDSIEFDTPAGMYTGNNLYKFGWREFKAQVKKNRNALFILYNQRDRYAHYIAKKGCNYVISAAYGGVIRPGDRGSRINNEKNSTGSKLQRRMDNLKTMGITGYFKHVLHIISTKFFAISGEYQQKKHMAIYLNHPPLHIFTSTNYTAALFFTQEELAVGTTYIHAMDYDRYIEVERENDDIEPCIVYCDVGYAAYDYDTAYLDKHGLWEPAKHKEEYFEQCERLFKCLEIHYNLPVIICGHPHTQYDEGDFCGRRIVFHQIHRLCRAARVFVVNTSTAMNFAEIYNIPTIKIANRYFKKIPAPFPNCYEFIKWEADVLGCGFLDMDDDEKMSCPWDYVKELDSEKRKDFITKYIIDSDIKDRTTYECIEEFIASIG